MLPDDALQNTGHITGMELHSILKRIEQRLRDLDVSADAASISAGKPDAIRNLKRAIESGRDGITTGTIAALSKALKTTEQWLLFEIGPKSSDDLRIPVWGRAGAGGIVNSFGGAEAPIGHIERTSTGAGNAAGAIEITGDSLGKVFNGWHAICDEVREPPTDDLQGKLCVLETTEGRVFIKKLVKGRGKNFTLVANVGRSRSSQIKWAAQVTDMVLR